MVINSAASNQHANIAALYSAPVIPYMSTESTLYVNAY